MIVNTRGYYEICIGIFNLPLFVFLLLLFVVLSILCFFQITFIVGERFSIKERIFNTSIAGLCLLTCLYWPLGFIDYSPVPGESLLIASWEGAANCTTTFELKSENRFIEWGYCFFGAKEFHGDFIIENDTLFFQNVQTCWDEPYFEFAILEKEPNSGREMLVRYLDHNDTKGAKLEVAKNEWEKGMK
ncbi:MAG: hypothetical protein AAF741_00760 [Bacteroidota bacterium]